MTTRLAAVLPSRNEAATVAGVARAVDQALTGWPALIINVDSSSDTTTHDAFTRTSLHATKRGLYDLPCGKGSQVMRGLADTGGAGCVLMLDTDTRNPYPARYRRLVEAVLDGADLALLDYRRSWFEGNLTNHVARPLIATATGHDIPQPIGGDIALSRRAVEVVHATYSGLDDELQGCVDGYGIDAFITRTIACNPGATVTSIPIDGVKRHAPSFPHLHDIFRQAVPVLLNASPSLPSWSLPSEPAFTLAPTALPAETLHDMDRRLAQLRADAPPASCTGEWPAPLADAWCQARAGEPAAAATRLWPAYLDRVRAYLALASRDGCRAAENTLVTAMATFLTRVRTRL